MKKEKILKIFKRDKKDDFEAYIKNLEDENIKFYIKTRIIEQINWYDKKSIHNQKVYKSLSIVSIILSGVIPILTLFTDFCWWAKVIVAVCGSMLTGISSINIVCNYKELWNRYRVNCEVLKSYLYLYITKQGIYKDLTNEQAFNQLVIASEKKFVEEFNEWSVLINSENKLNNTENV